MKLHKLFMMVALAPCISHSATIVYKDFDLTKEQYFVPARLASTSALCYRDGEFQLTLDDKEHTIPRYNVKGIPDGLSQEGLEAFLKSGYFAVGGAAVEPILQWQGRILGGGVLTSPWPKPSPTFPKIEDLEQLEEDSLKKTGRIKSRLALSFVQIY